MGKTYKEAYSLKKTPDSYKKKVSHKRAKLEPYNRKEQRFIYE